MKVGGLSNTSLYLSMVLQIPEFGYALSCTAVSNLAESGLAR